MVLHHSHDDVEAAQITYAQSSSDVQVDSDTQLSAYPCDDNSRSSSSIVAISTLRRLISRETLHLQIWTRIQNLLVDWWLGELLVIFFECRCFRYPCFCSSQIQWSNSTSFTSQRSSEFCHLNLGNVVQKLAASCGSVCIRSVQMAVDDFQATSAARLTRF